MRYALALILLFIAPSAMKTRDWLREYQDEAVWMILGPMLLGFGLRKIIYDDDWLPALGLFLGRLCT